MIAPRQAERIVQSDHLLQWLKIVRQRKRKGRSDLKKDYYGGIFVTKICFKSIFLC